MNPGSLDLCGIEPVGNFVAGFDAVFDACGIQAITTPPQAPRANAICERHVGTLSREILDRALIVSEGHLRRVLSEYATHYNGHRPHWSLGQHPPDADRNARQPVTDPTADRVRRTPSWQGSSTNTMPRKPARQFERHRVREVACPKSRCLGSGRSRWVAESSPIALRVTATPHEEFWGVEGFGAVRRRSRSGRGAGSVRRRGRRRVSEARSWS